MRGRVLDVAVRVRSATDPRASRIACLDSLRGIAALLVVAYHCWLAAEGRDRFGLNGAPDSAADFLLGGAVKVFEAGRAAVMLFFVLSGFVLARSLMRKDAAYAQYAVKRVLRIYPAFLVVVLLSYLIHIAIGVPHAATSALMMRVDDPDLSALELLKALALWGTRPSVDIDLVTWSLVHEMRISLLFPILLWSVQAAGLRSVAAYAALSAACTLELFFTTGNVAFGFVETTLAQTFAVSGYFIVFFAAGAYLAIEQDRVTRRLAALRMPAKAVLTAALCVLFFKGDHGAQLPGTSIVDYAHGIAAFGIIGLVLSTRRFSHALDHAGLVWLGRVSYGLYLVHLPVLYAVNQTFGAHRPLIACIAVVTISLVMAEIIARVIEFPSIEFGKRLGRLGAPPARAS